MKLYLIRHGKTIANQKHLYCGATDLPLSEPGILELLECRYEKPEACRFITSGMLRTEQTLYHLFGNVVHLQDNRFRELNFGVFEMKSYDELKDNPDYQRWISGNNEANIPPYGESGRQMTKRVIDGLNDLLRENKDTVLITHGGVITTIMKYLFPDENKNRYEWQPKPGQGYLITEGTYYSL